MKTLDETINNIETCQKYSICISCPYCGFNECKSKWGRDALYYLREYKEKKQEIVDISVDYVALKQWWTEQQENPPLTWNELKTMKGKLVWVEFFYEDEQHFDSDWFLVGFVSELFCDVIGKLGTSRLIKNDYWEAYRKEKNE